MITVGAHVSTAGGLVKGIERAQAIGADAMQIFVSSPQSWARRVIHEEEITAFREAFAATKLHSVWVHGCYLMNFGAQDEATIKKSIMCLASDLMVAEKIGAQGVIFHTGSSRSARAEADSHGGHGFEKVLPTIIGGLKEVVKQTPRGAKIILENSAGMGGSIGSTFGELGAIIKGVNSDRLNVCIDTQHAFAAGYPIHTEEGLTDTLAVFDDEIGLERLAALHANDSKIPFHGGRDRHENIGEGFIGKDGWKVLTHHPKLKDIPFLLEVPGVDHTGPNKENVDRLRKLAG